MTVLLLLPLPRRRSAAGARRGDASAPAAATRAWSLKLTEEVDAQVRVSGNVLAIFFKRPVDIPVDRINVGAADYIGAARRDPDGRALRFALARKVKVNSIAAAERLFVDLLPETWTGEPPGLPQEVVEELARRTREAERDARQRAELAQLRKVRPVNVRIAKQPTFTRFIFELPELDRRHHRPRQGQVHAEVRAAAEVRSGRRQACVAPRASARSTRRSIWKARR